MDQSADAGKGGDEEAAKMEPFLTQEPDVESKPPKEKPHRSARGATFKSICIVFAIVIVVIVIIAGATVLLIYSKNIFRIGLRLSLMKKIKVSVIKSTDNFIFLIKTIA